MADLSLRALTEEEHRKLLPTVMILTRVSLDPLV